MPAPPPVDRYQASFLQFPIQNNRTGFQPVFLPLVLVVPGRRTPSGTVLADSGVFDVRFFIADAPHPSKVAGQFNTGLLVPQLDRFIINVSSLQLTDVQIDPSHRPFFDQLGNSKDFEDAIDGDFFEYTLIRGATKSKIQFFKDADYYDMSLFTIDVEDLPRPDRYFFVWECKFKRRIVFDPHVATTRGAFCIDINDIAIAQLRILIAHPGEVHHEMFRKTPPFYFDNEKFKRADDRILQFYRPFADLLQDIFDEQEFLNGINHINRIPAQLIPYLAFLIGWDLPNFPGVTDEVRRSILRQAVRLQQLKGSRRALIELFDIFGFTIELLNLWFTTDGSRLVAPGERLPSNLASQMILRQSTCQIEPLVNDFSENGFGEFEVPLVFKPTTKLTLTAFLVKDGPTRDELIEVVNEITDDPDSLEGSCSTAPDGSLVPQRLLSRLPSSDSTVLNMSEVTIDARSGIIITSSSTTSVPLINDKGIVYDPLTNLVKVTFDHNLDFSDGSSVFLFATYLREKLIIPDELENLRSNRFDVRILLKTGQEVSPELLEFLLQFVFKLKAFHSLLRKIAFEIINFEVYNVTDYCFTSLQVPPPVGESPEPNQQDCQPIASDRGLKEEDLDLRANIFSALEAEHATWKALDGTHQSDEQLEKFLNLPVTHPEGDECQFTQAGQDRVLFEPNDDLDQKPDQRPKLCQPASPSPDNCFKGRVNDNLIIAPELIACEIVRCKPCSLGFGFGSYWLFPSDVRSVLRDGFGKFKGQSSHGFLGGQIFRYDHPIPFSLHYTNRPFLSAKQLDSDQFLAYRRPSLEVEKDNMLFPSHRLPTYANLRDDFKHPVWKAKPWDQEGNDLNAVLTVGANGDQFLVFDTADLIYLSNGLLADISSYGEHEDRSFLVTHKIWLVNPPGHPALTLDPTVVETQDETITFDSSVPFDPIFKSFNPVCNQDFRSGYPAETGRFLFDVDAIDFDRSDVGTDELGALLGLPLSERGTGSTGLFTYGSQILVTPGEAQFRFYEPFRFDCDCTKFECDTGGSVITGTGNIVNLSGCPIELFRQPDGSLDTNCDQLRTEQRVILRERIGVCSILYDGTIPNFLCVLDEDGFLPDGAKILPQGSFRFKDEYGVIYEGMWIFKSNVLDITSVVKSPHVWGEPDSGFLRGRKLFRRGIITTTRQIIKVFADGSYEIQGQSSKQEVDFFQSNVTCGDPPFVDKFCFHFDCAVSDKIDGQVICGPRWAKFGDGQVQWADLLVDSNGDVVGFDSDPGIQPFFFMSVWTSVGDDEIVAVCPGASGS